MKWLSKEKSRLINYLNCSHAISTTLDSPTYSWPTTEPFQRETPLRLRLQKMKIQKHIVSSSFTNMICAKLVNREWLHGWLCSQLDYSQVSFSYISSWFQHENFKVFEPWELLIVLAQTSRNATLFTALAFFHSITASLSMLIIFDFFYYIVNEEFSPQLLLLVLPLTACLLDAIVIRPYIRLWYRNALFFTVVSTLYCTLPLNWLCMKYTATPTLSESCMPLQFAKFVYVVAQ